MKKKLKLQITDLKIQSFITNVGKEETRDLKGGATLVNLCGPNGTVSQYHSFCRTCEFVCD